MMEEGIYGLKQSGNFANIILAKILNNEEYYYAKHKSTHSGTDSSTNSQSSDTPDTRSTMQNPCRGRISPRSEGLSLQDRQFLSTSLWKKCLTECRFSPTEEADALVQLVTQTGELKNHFDRFKDHFVSYTL